ncbi:MAG: DUF2207 domain-containing protein [Sulfurovum sp.]|nr:DUF2207 domain-containing protein [Sulfurovum sp.]
MHWGALFGALSYFGILFRRYSGFKDRRAVAVQYDPPEGLSLLQSGLLLDSVTDNSDYSEAILELGYMGYIKIEQATKETKPLLIRTDKEIENLTEEQRYLLEDMLFVDSKHFVLSSGEAEKTNALQSAFSAINIFLYKWSVSKWKYG